METATMGKVTVKVKMENLVDCLRAKEGSLSPDKIRAVEVDDALVDTGARYLSMPKSLIDTLGLVQLETRQAQTSAGKVPCGIYNAVFLTVNGRRCTVDVAEVAEGCSVLIGYFPLELLDFTVDPIKRQLVPVPQDGGQQVLDLY